MKTKRQMSRAVQEARAPKEVESDTPERRRWRETEWYATPPFACRAGAELINRLMIQAESIYEPACGDGIMAECLKEYFPNVLASDIDPKGYGARVDFLDRSVDIPACDVVCTNPPFHLAIEFLRRGLEVARDGVALLGRLSLLESEARYDALYRGDHPLTVLAPFSERVPMQLGPWNPACSTATSYAWFIWVKDPSSLMKWAARVHPIPPGTRARLSKPNDVRRFCRAAEMPLFTEGKDGQGDAVDAGAA